MFRTSIEYKGYRIAPSSENDAHPDVQLFNSNGDHLATYGAQNKETGVVDLDRTIRRLMEIVDSMTDPSQGPFTNE